MSRIIILLGFSLFFIACAKKAPQEKPEMYKNSELAVMMRAMLEEHKGLKASIEKGELPESYPATYAGITEAEATPNMDVGEPFKAFASTYFDDMDSLTASKHVNIKQNHNRVVKSCVTCHEQHCTGPIPTIERLYID